MGGRRIKKDINFTDLYREIVDLTSENTLASQKQKEKLLMTTAKTLRKRIYNQMRYYNKQGYNIDIKNQLPTLRETKPSVELIMNYQHMLEGDNILKQTTAIPMKAKKRMMELGKNEEPNTLTLSDIEYMIINYFRIDIAQSYASDKKTVPYIFEQWMDDTIGVFGQDMFEMGLKRNEQDAKTYGHLSIWASNEDTAKGFLAHVQNLFFSIAPSIAQKYGSRKKRSQAVSDYFDEYNEEEWGSSLYDMGVFDE